MEFDELNHLRDAVKNSPENIPLRKFLANALMKKEHFDEAEIEYKEALRLAPDDEELKTGLAEAFCMQEKTTLGLVLMEEFLQTSKPPAKAWLVYALLLLQSKQAKEAKSAYENTILLDD